MLNEPQSVLITGATGAIGEALALAYARPGRTLILHGRDDAALAFVALECTARGAEVQTRRVDLRDRRALADWMEELVGQGVPDLLILNAGINASVGPHDTAEPWDEIEALIEVNLRATLAIVHAVLPSLCQRKSGQIALMSSLAGWFGLPAVPVYSASKAALRVYGEALRGLHRSAGIRVNVILPGFVESAMCTRMPGPKPFLWPTWRAAMVIKSGLAQDRPYISFPFPLNFGTWFLGLLPARLSILLVRWSGYAA